MCLDVETDLSGKYKPVMDTCEDPAPYKDNWQLWQPVFYKSETEPYMVRIQSIMEPRMYLYLARVQDQEELAIGELDEIER